MCRFELGFYLVSFFEDIIFMCYFVHYFYEVNFGCAGSGLLGRLFSRWGAQEWPSGWGAWLLIVGASLVAERRL